MRDHGLASPPELLLSVEAKIETGYQAVRKLLNLPEPPDAILSSNGLLAAGAFQAIQERGAGDSKPIGFASFDETNWTTLVRPSVTVIEQPTYEIGQTATELLLRRIEEPARPAREVILKVRLIVRQSCGCP